MHVRKALLSVFALLALTFTSCGTFKRAGKDIFIGASTPVLMLYGGATDGLTTAKSIREGMGSGGAVQVIALPFTFFYHALEHGIYGLVHVADLPMCVLYGAAELHPYGPEVMPLDIYQGTWFDGAEDSAAAGTDAESGEMVPAGR